MFFCNPASFRRFLLFQALLSGVCLPASENPVSAPQCPVTASQNRRLPPRQVNSLRLWGTEIYVTKHSLWFYFFAVPFPHFHAEIQVNTVKYRVSQPSVSKGQHNFVKAGYSPLPWWYRWDVLAFITVTQRRNLSFTKLLAMKMLRWIEGMKEVSGK